MVWEFDVSFFNMVDLHHPSPSDRQKPRVQEKAVEQIAFPANGNSVPAMNGGCNS